MAWRASSVAAGLVIASVAPALAQSPPAWRVRFTDEASGGRVNTSSLFASPVRADDWTVSNQFLAAGDATWEPRARVKLGSGIALRVPTGDSTTLRVREAYGRVSVLSWLDVEAGKRLSRWGTGYAFTPTGLIDPPRDATDPQDRLGLNEGMLLVRADAFRGATAVTVAVTAPRVNRPSSALEPHRLAAVRVRTTVGGVDVAAVASVADDRAAAFGANFTHVAGRQLEYHGEVLTHDISSAWRRVLDASRSPTRTVSALVGMQYTFQAGMNVVVEYYRDGNGLNTPLWNQLVDAVLTRRAQTALMGSSGEGANEESAVLPSERPTRQHFVYGRVSRANGDALIVPELLTLVGLEDGGMTLVSAVSLTVNQHVQPYVRVVGLFGPARSPAGSATTRAVVSGGMTVRF